MHEEGGKPLEECRVIRALGKDVDAVRELEREAVVAGAFKLLGAQAQPLNEAKAVRGSLG